MTEQKDFFISYNKADLVWAEWLAWQLENSGYTTVIQAWDFRPGFDFVEAMERAGLDCKRVIAVLSEDYLSSRARYSEAEWHAAFRREREGQEGALLPVRVQRCKVEGLLGNYSYIDLVGLDEGAASEKLLAGLKHGRSKPDKAPQFPGGRQGSHMPQPRFPRFDSRIWQMPHARNPNFTGRQELLWRLREALFADSAAVVTPVLAGLGGVGKTQVALEYCYRYAESYSLLCWLNAEKSASLDRGFRELAERFGYILSPETRPEEVIRVVHTYLETHKDWLLVFDNATGPEDIGEYRPCKGGHVIVTSRDPNWAARAQPLNVEVFTRAESIAFLLTCATEQDRASADALAEELGDLPLALEHARAYMESRQVNLAAYLKLFRQERLKIFAASKPRSGYPSSVAATWDLSFEQVRKEFPAAADLLDLMAFLAPDQIPRDLFAQGAHHLPKALANMVRDDLRYNNALAVIRKYSLAEINPETVSMHRLMQMVTRDRLRTPQRKKWAAAALCLLNKVYPFKEDSLATWSHSLTLLPHGLAAAEYARAEGVALPEMSHLLNLMGWQLKTQGRFREARAAEELSLNIAIERFGEDHPETAMAMNNLATVLHELDEVSTAREYLEHALNSLESAYGTEHPRIATVLSNLAMTLNYLQDYAGAKEHLERVLKFSVTTYGEGHLRVAAVLSYLGTVHWTMGDLPQAKDYFQRALTIEEKISGREHPKAVKDLNNLALVLLGLGEGEEAQQLLEHSLALTEATYGPEHPSRAFSLNNLGDTHRTLGHPEKAKEMYDLALPILLNSFGEDHPHTKEVQRKLGELC